jgi:virginiamycin B lyase
MPVARLVCVAALAATVAAPAPRCLAAQPTPSAQGGGNAQPAEPVPVREWAVPWKESRPRDPIADAAGKVWFVGQAGNYVATLDPATGQFRRYEIDPGTHPHNVVVAPDGQAWYAGNRNAMIGRIEPASGRVTRFPMPDSAAHDPHTMLFAPGGDLWFTVQFGGYVGRLTPRTGAVRLVKIPTPAPPAGTPASSATADPRAYAPRPYGLALDSRGRPWFDLFGTNAIGTIDPSTMRLRTYALPHERARPRRIAVTSDDMIWYVDYTRGFLGRLDPRSGAVTEWANPSGGRSLPYAMAADDQDRLWYVETGVQPNRLVGFDPRTERVFSVTPIASGGGTVRHMTFDRATGQLWFGTDVGTIGRATVGGARRPISD